MRQHLVKAFATAGFLIATVVGFTGHAQGQSLADPVRVRIPFDFIVADKTLAAGEYYFKRAQPYSGDGMVYVASRDGKTRLIRLSNAVETRDPKSRVTLVFHRYGNQTFLAQVWPAGASVGRQLPKSREERELERQAREVVRVDMRAAPVVEIVKITVGP